MQLNEYFNSLTHSGLLLIVVKSIANHFFVCIVSRWITVRTVATLLWAPLWCWVQDITTAKSATTLVRDAKMLLLCLFLFCPLSFALQLCVEFGLQSEFVQALLYKHTSCFFDVSLSDSACSDQIVRFTWLCSLPVLAFWSWLSLPSLCDCAWYEYIYVLEYERKESSFLDKTISECVWAWDVDGKCTLFFFSNPQKFGQILMWFTFPTQYIRFTQAAEHCFEILISTFCYTCDFCLQHWISSVFALLANYHKVVLV